MRCGWIRLRCDADATTSVQHQKSSESQDCSRDTVHKIQAPLIQRDSVVRLTALIGQIKIAVAVHLEDCRGLKLLLTRLFEKLLKLVDI